MSKTASLLFAVAAVIMMTATAVAISHNGWLAALFFILTIGIIASGFIYKARLRRQDGGN